MVGEVATAADIWLQVRCYVGKVNSVGAAKVGWEVGVQIGMDVGKRVMQVEILHDFVEAFGCWSKGFVGIGHENDLILLVEPCLYLFLEELVASSAKFGLGVWWWLQHGVDLAIGSFGSIGNGVSSIASL